MTNLQTAVEALETGIIIAKAYSDVARLQMGEGHQSYIQCMNGIEDMKIALAALRQVGTVELETAVEALERIANPDFHYPSDKDIAREALAALRQVGNYDDLGGSVLPMTVEDTDTGEIVRRVVVDSISGGADSTDGEPNALSLLIQEGSAEKRVRYVREASQPAPQTVSRDVDPGDFLCEKCGWEMCYHGENECPEEPRIAVPAPQTTSVPSVDQVKRILDVHHNTAVAAERVVAYFKEIQPRTEEVRWIPVTDRLPDLMTSVLAAFDDVSFAVIYFDGDCVRESFGGGVINIENDSELFYWQPLPEPPTLAKLDKGGRDE